jgi:hypothetical protein
MTETFGSSGARGRGFAASEVRLRPRSYSSARSFGDTPARESDSQSVIGKLR